MNAMTQALVEAGVAAAPSKRERVWTLLKERGVMTAEMVSSVLGWEKGTAAQTLHQLAKAGTVEKVKVGRRGAPGTFAAIGATYQAALEGAVKPVRATNVAPAPQPTRPTRPTPADTPWANLPADKLVKAVAKVPAELRSYTVPELYSAYRSLRCRQVIGRSSPSSAARRWDSAVIGS